MAKMQSSPSRTLTGGIEACFVRRMKLSITADIGLDEPRAGAGYMTWLEVCAGGAPGRPDVRARVALLHVGEIADAHGDLWPALHGTPLEAVHDAYFEQGWYKDDYADGAGIDLLYVAEITVEGGVRDRNLDLAVVRRLADTIGSGCQLTVMPYRDAHEAAHWSRLGFAISTPGRPRGLMHMKLGYRHARVVATEAGGFEVLPTSVPGDRRLHN